MGKIVCIQYKHPDRHSSPGLEGIPPVEKSGGVGPLASHLYVRDRRALYAYITLRHI